MALWGHYIVFGTTEGELTVIEPVHWEKENAFHAVLKNKTTVK
jgi:hypothetical protein